MALDRTWFNALVDDDGSNAIGTVWNKTQISYLLNSVDGALRTVVTRTDTGTVNNWPPGAGDTVILWLGAANVTVNSLAPGFNGQQVTIRNSSGSILWCTHGATAGGNNLYNMAKSRPTPVGTDGFATYVFSSYLGIWLLTAHEQGAWLTPPYNAANFTASGGMIWTVDAGDIVTYAYRLSGTTLGVQIALNATSFSGTPNSVFGIAVPGGYTVAVNQYAMPMRIYDNSGTVSVVGFFSVTLGSAVISLQRIDNALMSPSTNNTYVYGTAQFPVQ